MRVNMEELASRRVELIMVALEEVKAKAGGSATRRKRRIGRMLAEAEGD